jgi:hypothetical protein
LLASFLFFICCLLLILIFFLFFFVFVFLSIPISKYVHYALYELFPLDPTAFLMSRRLSRNMAAVGLQDPLGRKYRVSCSTVELLEGIMEERYGNTQLPFVSPSRHRCIRKVEILTATR